MSRLQELSTRAERGQCCGTLVLGMVVFFFAACASGGAGDQSVGSPEVCPEQRVVQEG